MLKTNASVMPLILKKPREGLLAFRLGTTAALRETDSVIEQLREQLRSERTQHASKLAEKERELAELRYELARRDREEAFARPSSPSTMVH
jgi:hypothetical protein